MPPSGDIKDKCRTAHKTNCVMIVLIICAIVVAMCGAVAIRERRRGNPIFEVLPADRLVYEFSIEVDDEREEINN